MKTRRATKLTAGDVVWIATALLHREQPEACGFTVKEISERVKQANLDSSLKPMTIYQHAQQHCVANRPPNTSKLCLLTELPNGLRKLYRSGDAVHEARCGQPTLPHRESLSTEYRELLDWYVQASPSNDSEPWNPFADMAGSWNYGAADDYVDRLREGWQ